MKIIIFFTQLTIPSRLLVQFIRVCLNLYCSSNSKKFSFCLAHFPDNLITYSHVTFSIHTRYLSIVEECIRYIKNSIKVDNWLQIAIHVDVKLQILLYPLPDDLSLNLKRCLVYLCPFCIRNVHLKKTALGKLLNFMWHVPLYSLN